MSTLGYILSNYNTHKQSRIYAFSSTIKESYNLNYWFEIFFSCPYCCYYAHFNESKPDDFVKLTHVLLMQILEIYPILISIMKENRWFLR